MRDNVPFNINPATRSEIEMIFSRYGVNVGGLTNKEFNSMMEEITGEGVTEMWKDIPIIEFDKNGDWIG